MSKTLVIGANGGVGTHLVQLLKERGVSVRKGTSRPTSEDDEVHINLVTGAGIENAFKGADRAFLLSPPGHTNQDELMQPLIDEARRAGLKKVVLMTAMGANADPAAPLRKAEIYLEQSGLSHNIIRPNWFMQNFNTYWIGSILSEHKIVLPAGAAKGSFIDTRDIAAVAASLLLRHDVDNRDFDLTGPIALDHTEVAKLLSKETGRSITYQDTTPEAFRPVLLAAGLPPAYAEMLLTILGFFKAGYAERTTDAVQTLTGKAPRRFEEYAKDHRSAWIQ